MQFYAVILQYAAFLKIIAGMRPKLETICHEFTGVRRQRTVLVKSGAGLVMPDLIRHPRLQHSRFRGNDILSLH